MAAIEKVCEFSGEYPGGEMYSYKRNSLQILPKYRKKFKGAKHTLHVFKPSLQMKLHGTSAHYSFDESDMLNYEPPFNNVAEYLQYKKEVTKERLVKEHYYLLEVTDPNLAGEVDGQYLNWTMDLKTTLRKMKRMLKCKKLNLIKHDCSYYDWKKKIDSQ